MLLDISRTEDEVINSIRELESYKSESFLADMFDLKGKMNRLISAAKIYVLDNYQKVDNWSDLSLDLYHNKSEGRGKWFGPKRDRSKQRKRRGSDIMDRMLRGIDEKTTQIDSLTYCVYDWTDGDFSLKINGVDYLWIDGASVISIAQHIQDVLNERSDSPVG
jgi:hypothetical protein